MSEKETEKLFRSITELSDDLIENAQTVPAGGRKKTAAWKKWGAAAACLCLVIFAVPLLARIPQAPQGGAEAAPHFAVDNRTFIVSSHLGDAVTDELPEYKVPSLWFAFKAMCARGWAYIVKAATIILLCNTAVQIMQTFNWSFTVAETADSSILASIASPFAYLLVPIVGVLSWQLAAAAVTGFIAKENVVGTLAVCFVGLENFIDTEELAMMEGAGAEVAGIIAITKVAALAYLMFNLYTPPCFAAIGAMNSEMKSAKWVWGGIGLQLGTGYTVGFLVYQIGTLITTGSLGAAFVPGLIAVIVFAAILTWLCLKADKDLKQEYALNGART